MPHKIYYTLGNITDPNKHTWISFDSFDHIDQETDTVELNCNCDATCFDACPVCVLMYYGADKVKEKGIKSLYSTKLMKEIFGLPICKIRWIDANGKATPDTNDAIGYVQCEAYAIEFPDAVGGKIDYPESEWWPVCKNHSKQLNTPGMHHWKFKSLRD